MSFERADEGSRTLVISLEGWDNKPLYDIRKDVYNIYFMYENVNGKTYENWWKKSILQGFRVIKSVINSVLNSVINSIAKS